MGAPASPQVIGRYALHGKIASGGMASVCFGRLIGAVGFSRTVAVKRLHPHLAEDPDFVSTMIDEARLAARIHHPNVVPTLDVVAAEGELLVIMEYVRGESLGRLIRTESARKRRVPLPIVSAVVIGALQGLHAAHEATSDRGTPLHIVHRDVSPQNILVGVDGVARVIDFGVAKAAGRLQTTRDGVIKGKMAYMAPEQLAAEDVTRAADVYAMGIVLWEMLTGRRLFRGDTEAALFGQALGGAKDPPSVHAPDLPPELDELAMKALALDPAKRFATANEMAEALLQVVPPAFATVVGRWVEDAASESLARRGATLAEIEGSSGIVTVAAPGSRRPDPVHSAGRPADGVDVPTVATDDAPTVASHPSSMLRPDDDVPTVASQPSSISLETPKHARSGGTRSRRARLEGALAAIGLLGLGAVAALLWHQAGGAASAPSPAAASVSAPASAPGDSRVVGSLPPQGSTNDPPAVASSSASSAPPSAPASTVARPGAARPRPAATARPSPAAVPSGPFRFTPD